MNQQIQNLDYNNLLFLDIETIRGVETFTKENPLYEQWAWKNRNKETNHVPKEKKLIQLYNRRAALFPEWGKIAVISVGVIKEDSIVVRSYTGEEKDILKEVVEMIVSSGRKLCGHNLIGFDLPFIRRRFFINGLSDYLSDKQGNDVGTKPWLLSDCLVDTMDLWKGTSYYPTSLEELAMVFGIPVKETLHGHQVSDFYYAGKIDELKTYCESDVGAVANIIRKWKGDDILPLVTKEEAIKPLPLLERILQTKKLTSEDTDKIKEIVSNLTSEEKEKAKELTLIALGTSKKKVDKSILELFETNEIQENKTN